MMFWCKQSPLCRQFHAGAATSHHPLGEYTFFLSDWRLPEVTNSSLGPCDWSLSLSRGRGSVQGWKTVTSLQCFTFCTTEFLISNERWNPVTNSWHLSCWLLVSHTKGTNLQSVMDWGRRHTALVAEQHRGSIVLVALGLTDFCPQGLTERNISHAREWNVEQPAGSGTCRSFSDFWALM